MCTGSRGVDRTRSEPSKHVNYRSVFRHTYLAMLSRGGCQPGRGVGVGVGVGVGGGGVGMHGLPYVKERRYLRSLPTSTS